MVEFQFWLSPSRGLIRRRRAPGLLYHPEVWRDGRWVTGSPYVMDAITGMGEDLWSCGEAADKLTEPEAEAFAMANGIDLGADNLEDPS